MFSCLHVYMVLRKTMHKHKAWYIEFAYRSRYGFKTVAPSTSANVWKRVGAILPSTKTKMTRTAVLRKMTSHLEMTSHMTTNTTKWTGRTFALGKVLLNSLLWTKKCRTRKTSKCAPLDLRKCRGLRSLRWKISKYFLYFYLVLTNCAFLPRTSRWTPSCE